MAASACQTRKHPDARKAKATAAEQRAIQRQVAGADRSERMKSKPDGDMQAGARRYPEPPFPKQHQPKPGREAKPSQAKPSQAKPSQAKPSQAKLKPQPMYDAPFYNGSGKL